MNMGVNKVIYNTSDGERVLIDLTEDTVAPETLAEGVTAHDKSGEPIVGTMKASESGGGDDVASAIADRTVTEFISNKATIIGHSAFRACSKLKTLDMPNATSVGDYALYQCTALTSLNLPSVTSIGQQILYGCNKLMSIVLPSLTTSAQNSLREVQYAETIDFGESFTGIPNQMFYGCRGLKALILRSPTMVTLANTNAFTTCYRMLGTKNSGFNPNGERLGFVYIPRALIGEYQADSVWSGVFEQNQFRAIEDYPDICG